jgi:hypothetical protein
LDEANSSERPDSGPFDRILRPGDDGSRDRTATAVVAAIIVLGAILLVLVLPPISILSDDSASAEPALVTSVPRTALPPLPPGMEAVSSLYDLKPQEPLGRDQKPRVGVPLYAAQTNGEGLVLFTYDDDSGDWSRLADAELWDEGRSARAELDELPANVAVLRQTAQARQVYGTLGSGAILDPLAAETLTVLNPAGTVPTADGRLAGQMSALPPGLTAAVVPNVGALGPVEAGAVNAILTSPDLTATHVQELLAFVRNGNYGGIDIDYRAVDPNLGTSFTGFVQQLSQALRAENRSLTLTLPLPTESGDGWNTFGYDWRALAPLVDAIKLPMEPDQSIYYERMEKLLPFLTAQVGGSKLVLQVTPLAREQSVDGIRGMTLTDALAIASVPAVQTPGPVAPGATATLLAQNLAGETESSGMYWEDTSRSVLFSYPGPGGYRTVWLANVFSEGFRIDLARRYGLAGIAVEDVGAHASGVSSIWPVVQQYAATGEADLAKPNSDLLDPAWEATGGTLQTSAGNVVTWQAPAEPGSYAATLIVSDGVIRAGQQITLEVAAPVAAPP